MSEQKKPTVGDTWTFNNTGQECLIHAKTNARNVWYSCHGTGYYAGYVTWVSRARFLREWTFVRRPDREE